MSFSEHDFSDFYSYYCFYTYDFSYCSDRMCFVPLHLNYLVDSEKFHEDDDTGDILLRAVHSDRKEHDELHDYGCIQCKDDGGVSHKILHS